MVSGFEFRVSGPRDCAGGHGSVCGVRVLGFGFGFRVSGLVLMSRVRGKGRVREGALVRVARFGCT
jgi:hypothetical protein